MRRETRPDLVGLDRTMGKECVLIEAKFWAGLTDRQPKAYLDRLDPGKALLFVAPGIEDPHALVRVALSLAGVEERAV